MIPPDLLAMKKTIDVLRAELAEARGRLDAAVVVISDLCVPLDVQTTAAHKWIRQYDDWLKEAPE